MPPGSADRNRFSSSDFHRGDGSCWTTRRPPGTLSGDLRAGMNLVRTPMNRGNQKRAARSPLCERVRIDTLKPIGPDGNPSLVTPWGGNMTRKSLWRKSAQRLLTGSRDGAVACLLSALLFTTTDAPGFDSFTVTIREEAGIACRHLPAQPEDRAPGPLA